MMGTGTTRDKLISLSSGISISNYQAMNFTQLRLVLINNLKESFKSVLLAFRNIAAVFLQGL